MTNLPLERTIREEDMGTLCTFCQGRSFRRSRLQWKDAGTLLSMHYPVRCLSCSKRQTVALGVARRAVSSSVTQVRTPHDGTPCSGPGSAAEPAMVGVVEFSALPVHAPHAMPDLRGVRLPRVAYVPPGTGENLVD